MAGLLQLRTYTLKTAAAAAKYAPLWIRHKQSFESWGVRTLGVYQSRTEPQQVIALVQFRPGDDPDKIVSEYTGSEKFRKDMESIGASGVSKTDFESVDAVVLEEVEMKGR